MKFGLNFINFFVVSNLYVSIGVSCLTALSMHIYGLENPRLLLFVFFSTLFTYNLIRLVPRFPIISSKMLKQNKLIYDYQIYLWAIVFFSGCLSFFFVSNIYKPIFWPLLMSSILCLTYGLPLLKWKSSWISMRQIPGLKIFLIALVWTTVTEGFPCLIAQKEWSFFAPLERFLFVLAITIPFDIRDLKFDIKHIKTIPYYIGVDYAKNLGIICLVISELILAYRTFILGEINLSGCLAIYLSYEVAILLIYFSKEEMTEWYVSLGLDGVSILMCILFLLFEFLH